MDLIIGGAYNGKLDYALKAYGLAPSDVADLALSLPREGEAAKCAYHVEAVSRAAAKEGLSDEEALFVLEHAIRGAEVVIASDISGGVVPADRVERRYRELHGLFLARLAARAERVVRVFYGIGEVLK